MVRVALLAVALAAHVQSLRLQQTSSRGHSVSSLNMGVSQDSGRNLAYTTTEGAVLSYDLFRASPRSVNEPPIVFLPGLIRQKNEIKATTLQSWSRKNDYTFFCADYMGVGRSSGIFSDGTVGRWASDTIQLLDSVVGRDKANNKAILVGHGVGAWVSFLVAARRPDLVSGIVGMAADPDFTEELLWKKLPEATKEKIMREGVADITWGTEVYPISRALIEDGRENLLLTSNLLRKVNCPVRLVHALDDEEVPYELAIQLIHKCASPDASCTLIKGAQHSLDSEQDMKVMRESIMEILTAFRGDYDLTSPGSG